MDSETMVLEPKDSEIEPRENGELTMRKINRNSLRNLIPFNEMPKERHREISSRGGASTAIKRKRKKAERLLRNLCREWGVPYSERKGLLNFLAWKYEGTEWADRPYPEYGHEEPIYIDPWLLKDMKKCHISIDEILEEL